MHRETFGGVKIFRSHPHTVRFFRNAARAHLLREFHVGGYPDSDFVNRILQHQFEFFSKSLMALVPKLVTRDALEFVLFQYDQAGKILHAKGIKHPAEVERWLGIEGNFRRALKYLAEMICLLGEAGQPQVTRDESFAAMDAGILCAEALVDLAELSHRVHGVFAGHASARVFPVGEPVDFEVRIGGPFEGYDQTMFTRIKRDRENRHRFIVGHQFDFDTEQHRQVLNPAFEACFGWPYDRFLEVLGKTIKGAQPALNAFPTLFIHRGKLVQTFVDQGAPKEGIERIISGFTLSPQRMRQEKRVVWNPKQEHRAYRRGFFEFPHETGPHLAFSRTMAQESLIHLVNSICYKKLPEEWRHATLNQAQETLSARASVWFEETVGRNMSALGFQGARAKDRIGTDARAVKIPSDIGEIDYLGFHLKERLLVIAEAKMSNVGLEAKLWRDDVEDFVRRRNSYAEKFRRKIAWVAARRSEIGIALTGAAVERFAAVMVTLYPCIARMFITDFPCVSMAELMLDYRAKGEWPYQAA